MQDYLNYDHPDEMQEDEPEHICGNCGEEAPLYSDGWCEECTEVGPGSKTELQIVELEKKLIRSGYNNFAKASQ